MQQIARADTPATAALLKINGLLLILPQGEIRALESATDIDVAAPVSHSVGWVQYAKKHWPVYCLSEELDLMADVPAERRACALIGLGAGYVGLLCDDMSVLKAFTATQYELPLVMKLPDTPITHLLGYEQGIACASNAQSLTAYIEKRVWHASQPNSKNSGLL